jgi:hypothetical protein
MSDDEIQAAIEASNAISPLKSTEQGAATSVWAATSPKLDGMGGVYCEDVDIAEALPADSPSSRGVKPWAMDPALAERLWAQSEAWTGVTFSG